MKRGNTNVRRSRRQIKREQWEIYDGLPPSIRAILQEGPTQANPGKVDHFFRKQRRLLGEAAAIMITVEVVSHWHLRNISEGRDWWPAHPKRGWRYRSTSRQGRCDDADQRPAAARPGHYLRCECRASGGAGMNSTDDLRLTISWFETAKPDGHAFGNPETLSWEHFTSIFEWRREGSKDGPNFVPSRFRLEPDGRQVRRLKANLIARTAVALDVELNKATKCGAPSMVNDWREMDGGAP